MSSQPAPGPDRPKVIYVMGAGHSGSTILGLTLGNCSGVFFAGEIARWLRYDGVPRLPGEDRARFWRAVREAVEVPPEVLGRPARRLERSTGAFRVRSWREQRRLRGRYRRVTEELYRAIARAASATHVVDTSHFPRRARELQALRGIDLYLLFVVRDAQSVVASYGRENVPHKQTWKMGTANAYLWLTYLLSVIVFLRQPRERRLFVRHEDFVADPDGVIAEILARAGSAAPVPDLSSLHTGLAFQGNRLLRTDVVSLRGRPEHPARGSLPTRLLHLPWAAVFSRLAPAAGGPRGSRPGRETGGAGGYTQVDDRVG
jgi:Sulfotransferase family